MIIFNKIRKNNKDYLFAGFGEITKKAYLVKKIKDKRYITFDGLFVDVSKYYEVTE